MLMTILWGALLLGVVIFVHELGHFLAAKWRGVRVLRFSMGFGPAMFAVQRGETEYRLSWFPLGGYVQMAGDTPSEDGEMPASDEEFLSHPWYGRVVIAIAGPAANLITAFVVMVAVGLIGVSYPDFPNELGATADSSVAYAHGLREGDRIVAVDGKPVGSWVSIFLGNSNVADTEPARVTAEREARTFDIELGAGEREPFFSSLKRPSDPPVVGSVVTGMPAYKAGLREGDRILAVNGTPILVWEDLPAQLEGQAEQSVEMQVLRGQETFAVTLKPIDPGGGGEGGQGRIGIEAPRRGVFIQRHGVIESLELGWYATGALVANVYGGMWLTISRPLYYREYLGGPMFIAQAAGEQARRGLDSYLQFLAMINIAIMAFNLMPLPLLDGGHILLALLQAVRQKALSARAYMRFQQTGLVVIGALFIFILANDPLRLIQRQRALGQTPQAAPTEETVAPNAP
jgi:regulator of sigma E protease